MPVPAPCPHHWIFRRDREFADSSLEEAVRSELVSEMRSEITRDSEGFIAPLPRRKAPVLGRIGGIFFKPCDLPPVRFSL